MKPGIGRTQWRKRTVTKGSRDRVKHWIRGLTPGRLGKPGQHLPDRARQGLDSATAFEILSIDIADVDVGKSIDAELQTDQAEADKRVAQARAEERRAMAVAVEQEMHAKVEEMRALV